MKKPLYLLIIIISIVVIFYFFYNKDYTTNDPFLDTYNLKIISETPFQTTIRGEKNENIIRINLFHNISPTKAMSKYSDIIFSIDSLYQNINSPYPGVITNKIVCPDSLKPIIKNSSNEFKKYIVYASRRLTYGVCSEDLIKYKSLIYFDYCKPDFRMYELFVPLYENLDIYEKKLSTITCINEKK